MTSAPWRQQRPTYKVSRHGHVSGLHAIDIDFFDPKTMEKNHVSSMYRARDKIGH